MRAPWTVPNYMGQTAQGQLAALPGANQPRTFADLEAEMAALQDQQAMADQLMQVGYVPNSGAIGAIAQVFGAYKGNKMKKEAAGKVADLFRESSELMTRKEREELEKKAREQQAEFDRKMKAAMKAGHSEGAAYAIAEGVPLPKSQEPKVMKVGNQLVSIGADGKPQVIHEAPRAPQAGPEVPADIRTLQAYMALSPEEQAVYDRLKGRDQSPAQLSAKDQQAQQLRGVSADQADTLIGQLEGFTKQGVGGPISGRVPSAISSVFNPSVEAYETTRAQLVDEITRLRRVPGIGAQSDLELRTALAAIPGAETNEATRAKAFANLRDVIQRVKAELGGAKPGAISGRADASGWSMQAIE